MYKSSDYKLTEEEYRKMWEEWDISDLMEYIQMVIDKKTNIAYENGRNDLYAELKGDMPPNF